MKKRFSRRHQARGRCKREKGPLQETNIGRVIIPSGQSGIFVPYRNHNRKGGRMRFAGNGGTETGQEKIQSVNGGLRRGNGLRARIGRKRGMVRRRPRKTNGGQGAPMTIA